MQNQPTIVVELTGAEAVVIANALLGMRADLAGEVKTHQECVEDFKQYEARGVVQALLQKFVEKTGSRCRGE